MCLYLIFLGFSSLVTIYCLPTKKNEDLTILHPPAPPTHPHKLFSFSSFVVCSFSKHDFWVKKSQYSVLTLLWLTIIYSWATNCSMINFLSYMSFFFFFNGLEVIIFILIGSITNSSSKFSVKVLKLLLASQTSKVIYRFHFLFWDFPLGFSILLSHYRCVVWELSVCASLLRWTSCFTAPILFPFLVW